MASNLGWSDWCGKEHKQVKESRELGIRDDYCIVTFPKTKSLSVKEITERTDELMRLLLNSRFKTFVVCPKFMAFASEEEPQYWVHQAIEIGCRYEYWGHLREILSSIGVDFNNDQCNYFPVTSIDFEIQRDTPFFVSSTRSKKYAHLVFHSPEASLTDYTSRAVLLSRLFDKNRGNYHRMPYMSVENVFWFCQEAACHPLGRGKSELYLEVMFRPEDDALVNEAVSEIIPKTIHDENIDNVSNISLRDVPNYFTNTYGDIPLLESSLINELAKLFENRENEN